MRVKRKKMSLSTAAAYIKYSYFFWSGLIDIKILNVDGFLENRFNLKSQKKIIFE